MASREDLHPPLIAIRMVVERALAEDLLPLGDLTATLLSPETRIEASIAARRAGVLAGTRCVAEVFAQVDPGIECHFQLEEGDAVARGSCVAQVSGRLASLVVAERSALNLLCHLSGIATLTARYVALVKEANPETQLLDTRKTTPGLRSLEKAAVRAGGGVNHRGNLSEGVLVKDNHLGGMSITRAVTIALQRWPARMVEVECDRFEQVKEAVAAGATVVMCDNMTPEQVAEAVRFTREGQSGPRRCLVEASGGITLESVASYARAGADLISVGAITHSAPILDFGLDLAS